MSNENRIARIAREIVNDVSPSEIMDLVQATMKKTDLNRLYEAVEPNYQKDEQRLKELDKQLKEALTDDATKKIFNEYGVLWWADHCNQQGVFFHLGFASAMRLVGVVTPAAKLKAVG